MGEKVTLTVQLAPAASVALQVVVRANPAGAPLTASVFAAAPPVFEIVTDWLADVAPTFTLPKASEFGDAATFGVAPRRPFPTTRSRCSCRRCR